MIAEKDIHMKAAAEEMYVLSADELIQQRCRARDDYMKNENTRNKIMKELTEELEVKNKELESKNKQLESKDKQLESKDKQLTNALEEIQLLKKQLAEATLKNN